MRGLGWRIVLRRGWMIMVIASSTLDFSEQVTMLLAAWQRGDDTAHEALPLIET